MPQQPDEGLSPSVVPSNAPCLLAAEGLSVRAGGKEILQGIDLEIRPGEIVTVIGPNGAGKTTLLRVLLGVLQPASGRVIKRPGLRVGYVPQRLYVDPILPLTVSRFLRIGRVPRRFDLQRILAEVGAEELTGRMLHNLSGGEFQRVVLARALLRDPELLILDEPAQGVDVTGQADLYELFARLRRQRGCSVLLVSHDLHMVMAATDRVICIDRRICCSGHPEHVVRDPAYTRLFGVDAAKALAVYAHHHRPAEHPEPTEGAHSA
jgi:zinc transport system ATP-binding protein